MLVLMDKLVGEVLEAQLAVLLELVENCICGKRDKEEGETFRELPPTADDPGHLCFMRGFCGSIVAGGALP